MEAAVRLTGNYSSAEVGQREEPWGVPAGSPAVQTFSWPTFPLTLLMPGGRFRPGLHHGLPQWFSRSGVVRSYRLPITLGPLGLWVSIEWGDMSASLSNPQWGFQPIRLQLSHTRMPSAALGADFHFAGKGFGPTRFAFGSPGGEESAPSRSTIDSPGTLAVLSQASIGGVRCK